MGVEVQLHTFLTLAQDEGEWSVACLQAWEAPSYYTCDLHLIIYFSKTEYYIILALLLRLNQADVFNSEWPLTFSVCERYLEGADTVLGTSLPVSDRFEWTERPWLWGFWSFWACVHLLPVSGRFE